jgi:hypothetical protein
LIDTKQADVLTNHFGNIQPSKPTGVKAECVLPVFFSVCPYHGGFGWMCLQDKGFVVETPPVTVVTTLTPNIRIESQRAVGSQLNLVMAASKFSG